MFRDEPELFYSLVGSLLTSFDAATPSPTHKFLAALARAGKLRRVYTQNIDSLETRAGVPASAVVQCHGSLEKAACVVCGAAAPMSRVSKAAAAGSVAWCRKCRKGAVKPSIVFFHEALPSRFHTCLAKDLHAADMVMVMGSSLSVAPVSTLLRHFPPTVPAVLVNMTRLPPSSKPRDKFDVECIGEADVV